MRYTVKAAAACALVCVAAAALLYIGLSDPATAPLPQCIFRRFTGFDCPGCGTQRALHALLHGRLSEAWHLNAALLPGIALAGLYAWSPRRLRPVMYSSAAPWVIAGAIVAWWIGRNL
ncbi:MAG: DUF2752 domain-containing protein [Bacteroides sp.]|nr:DUF2752 domain-containing protein [Bacteroides sp.]MCM1095255.1 DUF2752 domain-containing protein [Terasakiella sp.]